MRRRGGEGVVGSGIGIHSRTEWLPLMTGAAGYMPLSQGVFPLVSGTGGIMGKSIEGQEDNNLNNSGTRRPYNNRIR